MDGLRPVIDEQEMPDVFIDGEGWVITEARTYFRLKHVVAWYGIAPNPGGPCPIRLQPWETWDRLGLRVEARLGQYLWHPSHWDRYYETLPDTPASAPGATPRTMAEICMAHRASWEPQQEETRDAQYALF